MADGEELYVKIVKTLDDGEGGRCLLCLWKWFKWRFLGGRALKALTGTVKMRDAGVHCAEAVLAARRTHWLRAEEIFISRGVPYPSVMKIILETTDTERRKEVLRNVAAGLCDFHCHGFLHGDCIPGNLLWDGEHIHFIDNDRTQLANGCLLQRGVRRNLVQFCFRMSWSLKDFSLAEYFLECYSEAMTARGNNFYGAEDVMEKARQRYKKKEAEKTKN
jgi:tRNA A-37 threonylcarbamoyl transferase component Bud32